MSKRLHDTEIWKKPWFFGLSDKDKLFWFYILSDCDAAGIWTANWKIAEAYLGQLEAGRLREVLKNQIIELNDGSYWFIKDFIKFQYGYPVSEKHTMFKSLKNILQNRGLSLDTVYDTVCNTVLDTVKDKDKEIDKENKGGVGGFFGDVEFDLSFLESRFNETFTRWIQYKKTTSKPFRNNMQVEAAYSEMLELSGNDPLTAKKIVNQSISNNYLSHQP